MAPTSWASAQRANLRDLDLFNCPVTEVENYRQGLFDIMPNLKHLDGFDADDNEKEEDDEDEDEDDGDAAVPSRTFMKKSSERTYNDTVKRTEQAEKRALMLERIKGEDGDIDPALASMKMRKKQQTAANKRLAQGKDHKHGVNPRDDAMARSDTFLKNTPSLQ